MKEEEFEIIHKLKRVEAPDYLYDRILNKIQNEKSHAIPLYKVAIAASLILALTLIEIVIVNHKKPDEIQSFEKTLVNNNHLYNE